MIGLKPRPVLLVVGEDVELLDVARRFASAEGFDVVARVGAASGLANLQGVHADVALVELGVQGDRRQGVAHAAHAWAARPRAIDRETLARTLTATHGNKAAAARSLGVSRRALYRRLAAHGLHRAAAIDA